MAVVVKPETTQHHFLRSGKCKIEYCVILLCITQTLLARASLDPVYGPREHPVAETFGYDLSSNISDLDRELWDAVLQGDLNLANISSILTNGADPNSYDEKHQTALHRAAWKGQRLTVTLLCSRGAFIDAQDAWTRTPLHFAAAYGMVSVYALCRFATDLILTVVQAGEKNIRPPSRRSIFAVPTSMQAISPIAHHCIWQLQRDMLERCNNSSNTEHV